MYRALGALVLSIAVLVPAASAQATFPGRNGLLAYGTRYGYEYSNWFGVSRDVAGFSERQIRTGAVDLPRQVAWSPDGRRLAFAARAIELGSGNALFIINADGTGLRQVGRGDQLRYNPSWSPDGTKLAFVQDNGAGAGSGDIYTITTTGANPTRLTTSASWDSAPDWSPTGAWIAYVCWSGGRRQLCQMTPTGAGKTVTTAALSLPGPVEGSSWSPDGANLLFLAQGSEWPRIYRVSRAGTGLRLLVGESAQLLGYPPAWSPDGTRFAFETINGAGGAYVITARVSDAGDRRATIGGEGGFDFDAGGWQPLR